MQNQSEFEYFRNYCHLCSSDQIVYPTGRDGYDPQTAWWLGECSRLAYASKHVTARELGAVGFTQLFFFDFESTQAYLAIHPGAGQPFAVLAFRGTEKDYLDILTDIIILKTKLPDPDDAPEADKPVFQEGAAKEARQPAFAHGGFLEAFKNVWGTALPQGTRDHLTEVAWIGMRGINNILQEKLTHSETGQPIPLYVTGHSLGGAIATLTAYHALTYHDPVYLYTFGSPRVGNTALAQNIDHQLPIRAYRCVHRIDIVPRIPFWFNYHHVQEPIFLNKDKGRLTGTAPLPNNILVVLRLLLEMVLYIVSFKALKPQTTIDHSIAFYVEALEKEIRATTQTTAAAP